MPATTKTVGEKWEKLYSPKDRDVLSDHGINLPGDDKPFKPGTHCRSGAYGDSACYGACWGSNGDLIYVYGYSAMPRRFGRNVLYEGNMKSFGFGPGSRKRTQGKGHRPYTPEELARLAEHNIEVPQSGRELFRPGLHCPGDYSRGLGEACRKNGCTGFAGTRNLPGIPLPCHPAIRDIGSTFF